MEASCWLSVCLMKHCREYDIGSSKSKVAHGEVGGQIPLLFLLVTLSFDSAELDRLTDYITWPVVL